MKTKIFELTAILLVLAVSFSSCKNDSDLSNIDFSNIENLHAQPLPVIQKCVEGKWKWISYSTWGVLSWTPPNTFINITNDSVIAVGDNDYAFSFSYRWEENKTLFDYTTYVMWNNEQDREEWFFDNIRNDTLFALSYKANPGGYNDSYLFLRIK